MATAVEIGQATGSIIIGAAAFVAAWRADRSSRRVESHVGGNGMGSLMDLIESSTRRLGSVQASLDAVDERVEHVERRMVTTADRIEAWADRQADHLSWHQAGQPERRKRVSPPKAT